MGTAISIDVRDPQVAAQVIDNAFEWLIEVDHRFSTFKPESEISRLGRGELTIDDCHPDVDEVLAMCEDLREKSGGAFNAWRARADGRLDPSGIVKGWAVDRAVDILEAGGARNFCISAGGDVVVRGHPQPGRAWRIGIQHPEAATQLAAVVGLSDMAVATSGSYERGHHIIDARTGRAADELISLTVLGENLASADACATAGFAMGISGISWVAAQPGYSVYGVTLDGRVRYDDGFAARLEL